MNVTEFPSLDLNAMRALATSLAENAAPGDVLALTGEVGTGKTTFAQSFIGALLAKKEPVTSPTFTLMQRYETKGGFPLLHADLYRLKDASELMELGLGEALESHVSLIEWPEIASELLPRDTLHIALTYADGDTRRMTLTSSATKWFAA